MIRFCFRLYSNLVRDNFGAKTAFICLLLSADLALKGDKLLYNGLLSFRLTGYLEYESSAAKAIGRLIYTFFVIAGSKLLFHCTLRS